MTGGSRGIGAAMASALVEKGAEVVIGGVRLLERLRAMSMAETGAEPR